MPGAATATSIRRRCSTRGRRRCTWCPSTSLPATGEAGERSAIGQLIGGAGRLLDGAGGAAGAVGTWLRDGGSQLLRTLDHYGRRFTFPASFVDSWCTMLQAWQRARSAADRPCTAAGDPVPPPSDRRVACSSPGSDRTARGSTVDQVRTDELGYSSPDVLRFSYAGGRVPDPTDGFPAIPVVRLRRRRDPGRPPASRAAGSPTCVEEVAAGAPGVPIDLIAHSQGGVVARPGADRARASATASRGSDRVGMLATLGSPHGGADLATAVHAWSSTETGGEVLDAVGAATGQELDDDAPSITQLGETSDLVAELARPPRARRRSTPCRSPPVATSWCPCPAAGRPGWTRWSCPLMGTSAHSDLPGQRPRRRASSPSPGRGSRPGCQSFRDALLDQGVGEGISLLEDLAGAGGFLVAARADVRGG